MNTNKSKKYNSKKISKQTKRVTMKHTKRVTMKHTKRLTSKDNISILSYNISWESMSGRIKDWALCSNNTNPKHPKHNSVCVSNIGKVINQNPTDFITLQEATDYKKLIIECPRLNKMDYKVHNSGLDVIVTFWDAKYKLHSNIVGEFEHERPWMANIFTNGLCLINVHFGHYSSNGEYKHLANMMKKLIARIEKDKITCNRYIISGDFNYDIKDFGDKKGIINLDGIRFYHHPKHILTCCISRRCHNDHVIDSYKAPLDIYIPNVDYMASDHKPIIAVLHK
jgi:endonuclease/exonuclease/phosphatase family metal-dependent hydrolase